MQVRQAPAQLSGTFAVVSGGRLVRSCLAGMAGPLAGLYVVQVAATVDNVVVTPTMFHYLDAMCTGVDASECDATRSYGVCQSVYFLSRVACLWFAGGAIDRARTPVFKAALSWCLATGTLGSMVYASAPVLGGHLAVIGARALLGAKTPDEGTVAPMFLLFGEPEGNGRYYGSDAQRSPLDAVRKPGSPPFEGP